MGNQEIEERQGEENDEAEVNPYDAAEVVKLVVEVGMTQNSKRVRTLRSRRSRIKRVLMQGITQSGGFHHRVNRRIGRIIPGNPRKNPLVRGGLPAGGHRGGRGGGGGNRAIAVIDNDLKRRSIIIVPAGVRRTKDQRMRVIETANLGMLLVKRRRRRKQNRIEIGRDATAFFPDLNFRLLLMHYLYTNKHTHNLHFISLSLSLCYLCKAISENFITF